MHEHGLQTSWLFAALAALMRGLRRLGWPAGLRELSEGDARGYALGTAYMLLARLWTLRRGEPGWAVLWRRWQAAEHDVSVRDALAGRLADGDRIELIADGAAGFARRAAAFAAATQRIDIASYYLQSDDTGRDTVRALADCVARGVQVRLLVDHYMMFKKTQEVPGMAALMDDIARAGIALRGWRDPQRPYDSNHRKMIVVDDSLALVGGRNFADHYRGNAWRDVDLVLEGPSVAPLARLFDAVWSGSAAGAAGAPTWSPWIDHRPADVADDPLPRFVLSAVGAARATVDLELAYFVAHDALCDALLRAAARGVRVRLLSNSAASHDLPYAVWTAYAGYRRLLQGGCAVHARRGAGRTLHSKYVLVDDQWVCFGSHNLDYYSSRYACETNLVVRDARLGAQLADFFESGVAQATPMTLDEVQDWLARHAARRHFDRVFRDFQ